MHHCAGPECETISEHLTEVALANYTEGLQHTVFSWESQHGLLRSSSSATLSCFWGTLRRQWMCPEQLSRVDLSEASLSDNWTTSFGNFSPSSPPGCLGSSPYLQMLCQAVLQMNLTHLWPCPYSHLAEHVNSSWQVNISAKKAVQSWFRCKHFVWFDKGLHV